MCKTVILNSWRTVDLKERCLGLSVRAIFCILG